MAKREEQRPNSPQLLYPFYLDEDMSTAFAAALAGGIALESEQTDRNEDASKAVKSLRGSLRLFGTGTLDGSRARSDSTASTTEATFVRRHTAHSIFIDLHDELIARNQILTEPNVPDVEVGTLVSMRLDPAVAPLRRVVDQVLRLLDVVTPNLSDAPDAIGAPRQQRRQRARDAAKGKQDDPDFDALGRLHRLFTALRDDLDRSGMVDVVVRPDEDAPGPRVVLTLDKRFADPTALELLHTSSFTVVGKVTRVWRSEDDAIFLYRRSVTSLVPALTQQLAIGVFGFLVGVAKSIGPIDVAAELNRALYDEDSNAARNSSAAADDQEIEQSGESADDDDDVRIGDDIVAMHPILNGPAIQILPLALCV